MKNPPPSFLLLTLTILLSSFHSFVHAKTNLIQQTCKNCSNSDPNISYKFCMTSLQSDHRSICAQNLHELGLISIKITRHNVTDTISHIKELLKNKKRLDPFIKECLDDCFEVYSDSITTFREAIRDYKAKRYEDCNFKISSVIDASTTCEEGFNQKSDVVSPLTKRNQDVFQLSAINLSIINMLNVDELKDPF